MQSANSPYDQLVWKLGTRARLTDRDRAAIQTLPYTERSYHATSYIVREGEAPRRYCDFIQKGLAFRQKLTANGARQIVSIQLPGDFVDLQHLFLNIADHNVQALTEMTVVSMEREALRHLALEYPKIGEALWVDALVEASMNREWVLNLGQRDARGRIAHILCEVFVRLKAWGVADEDKFELPLTQEQLADAVGLTPVHVNRTLKSLMADGIIYRDKRYISFTNWDDVAAIAGFSGLYLHLDQVTST